MAYELNKKLRSVDPYIPINGEYPVRLDANESCYNINKELGEIISEEISKIEFNRYPDPTAQLVTEAFAKFYDVPPECCTAGNGSDELISVIIGSFLEKDDTILTLSPDFSMYAFYGAMSELKVKNFPKEDDLKINVSKVIEYCNNNDVKAVIFSNPCNPTSLGVTRQDIIRLVKNVFCLVIIDEAYMDFWGESVLDQVQEFDNLIVLKTCSKNMGLAALRLGFAVASEEITAALRAVKSPYNVNAITQAAGCAVLKNKPLIMEYTAELINSRKSLQKAICEIAERFYIIEKVYDSVTNFVFIKTSKSKDIYEGLQKMGIAVRHMGAYLRITAGSPEENQAFLDAFENVISLL